MKLSSIFIAMGLTTSSAALAQTTIINETFTQGIPNDWTIVIEDTNTVNDAVIEFTPGWTTVVDTVYGNDTVAGATSYFQSPGKASRWLITPALNLGAYGNKISWNARSFDPSYPDRYKVLVSTTDNQLSSFTDTIGLISMELEEWKNRSYALSDSGYNSQTIYVAFVLESYDKFKLYLDDIIVTVNDPVGITENNPVEWSIFPNPVKEIVTIETEETIEKWEIRSLDGQKQKTSLVNNTINCAELSAGTYFIRIETESGVGMKRFVKQ